MTFHIGWNEPSGPFHLGWLEGGEAPPFRGVRPTGIGAVAAAAYDRAKEKFDETQLQRETELREIIARAVLGERTAHPKVKAKPLSKTARTRVVKESRIEIDTAGLEASVAEISRLITEMQDVTQYIDDDEEAIAILLMSL